MGAKHYAAVILMLVAASGCSGWARFAPPGIIKYEELAGDQPPNPAIVERVAERKQTHDATYPRLSQQPGKTPEGVPEGVRREQAAQLRAEREALATAIAADRAGADAEQTDGQALEDSRDALTRAVEKDAAAARRERRTPLVAPENHDGE